MAGPEWAPQDATAIMLGEMVAAFGDPDTDSVRREHVVRVQGQAHSRGA